MFHIATMCFQTVSMCMDCVNLTYSYAMVGYYLICYDLTILEFIIHIIFETYSKP